VFSNDITDIGKRPISELPQLSFNPVSQTMGNKPKPESVTEMCATWMEDRRYMKNKYHKFNCKEEKGMIKIFYPKPE
jgi:hypothetical protein